MAKYTFHYTICSLAEDAFTYHIPAKDNEMVKFVAVLDFCHETNIIESWNYRAALEGFVLRAIEKGLMDYMEYNKLIDAALKSSPYQELPEKWADLTEF